MIERRQVRTWLQDWGDTNMKNMVHRVKQIQLVFLNGTNVAKSELDYHCLLLIFQNFTEVNYLFTV